jgi:hypothetical protein
MSLTKLSLDGNNKSVPGRGELISDIPAGDGKTASLFLQCTGDMSRDNNTSDNGYRAVDEY